MPTNEILHDAIDHFEHGSDTSEIRPGRKKFLDQITCRDDKEGLRIIDTIGGERNNMLILAGAGTDGHTGVISFSFVRKEEHFALQIISTLPDFVPDEQLVVGFKLTNGKEILSGFVFPPVMVENTSYRANYAQISHDDLAAFIEAEMTGWQLKNKLTNAALNSDFTILSADILPHSEARYLMRSMAAAIARDYLKSEKTT